MIAGQSETGVGLVAGLGKEEPGESCDPEGGAEYKRCTASLEEQEALKTIAGRSDLENAAGGEEHK